MLTPDDPTPTTIKQDAEREPARAHELLRLRAAVDATARGGSVPSAAAAAAVVLLQEGPTEAAAVVAAGASEKRPRPDSEEGAAAADACVVWACLGYATGVPTAAEQQQEAAMPRAAFGVLLRMLAPRWAWGPDEAGEEGEQQNAEENSEEAAVVVQDAMTEI
jgi:hypothetical protein